MSPMQPMTPLQNVLTRLERVRIQGSCHTAKCPAHDDERASLSVSEGKDGQVLLKCHAGCEWRQVVEALGLTISDLFPPREQAAPSSLPKKILTNQYDYIDESGKLLYQALRYQPKEFRQRAPDGKGGWSWSLQGVRRVPYRLPKVIEQANAGKTVFIVEGEKDADALGELGLTASTNAGGAGKWLEGFGKYLSGAHVIILPDNDEPGTKHAREVAMSCLPYAASVRIVELPGLPVKGDVSDWLKLGGQRKSLLDLVKASPRLTQEDMENVSDSSESGRYRTYKNTALGSDGESCASSEITEDNSPPVFNSLPSSLEAELLPVSQLTPEMLPPSLRAWLLDVAQRLSCPLEYVAIPAIVAVGAVIGKKIGIQPKRYDDWREYPNLWGAIVGRPGALKTPAISEALKHLYRLEKRTREKHEELRKFWAVESLIKKGEAERARTELKNKNLTAARKYELAEQVLQTEDEEPNCPRWIINDTTIEKLGELLKANPNGMLLYRDELMGFLRTLERQGHESDRAFYLEAWNGKGCFTYDRIGRGTVFIPSVCLSLVGSIQPGPLSSYLRASSEERGDDGFTSRFQLLVWPDPAGYHLVDRWADAEAKKRVAQVFDALAEWAMSKTDIEADEESVACLRFAPEAQQLFYTWLESLEYRMRDSGETALMETHLSKYRKLVPALALIFHLLESIDSLTAELPPVSLDSLERALAWAEFLETHARRIYQAVGEGDPEAGQRLGQRIKQSLPNPFTVRQVVQKHWAGLSTTDDVERAIGLLEERGWVQTRGVQKAGGGRPSVQIWINPALLGANKKSSVSGGKTLQNLQNQISDSSFGFITSATDDGGEEIQYEEGEI
ncbi:DUF3987 domain-containing protein [Armatimonas rosea]|uniref:DUF3987 domain-containing protein n=1 Tax=Armatimonas rosea TaxID=685828 RepID=A0A7W9W6B6_ARMRO|nr:DUF3987 domain-containing protein [Armatimonas rosea]MBB6050418.1 hypothetical protein [Armatimonas rosea]